MWDRKPVVGRGPRDQSSGQKPRARLPEVLACPAALRFVPEGGRWGGAGLPRLLLNRGLNPFLGGVLDECGSEHTEGPESIGLVLSFRFSLIQTLGPTGPKASKAPPPPNLMSLQHRRSVRPLQSLLFNTT